MSPTRYPGHQGPAREAAAAPASVSRLTYQSELYKRPADAVAGMRAQLREGWRIVQIRGPADGPFEVAYLRELRRDRSGSER